MMQLALLVPRTGRIRARHSSRVGIRAAATAWSVSIGRRRPSPTWRNFWLRHVTTASTTRGSPRQPGSFTGGLVVMCWPGLSRLLIIDCDGWV